MQEDANRGVPEDRGHPVTNASTASARNDDFGTTGRILVMAGGLVVLAILASLFV